MSKGLQWKLWPFRGIIVLFWSLLFYGMLLLSRLNVLLPKQDYINMYTWSDRISESLLLQFEKETGIKVYMSYYDSTEEMITKLGMTSFFDCDIILTSDYIIEDLIASKLLKKIDYNRCAFIEKLYSELRGQFYDPQNEYTIPLYWDVVVIGYSNKKFPYGLPENSWSMIFEKNKIPCRSVAMVNDGREALCLTLKYFNLDKKKQNFAVIKKMKNVLIQQRDWVGAYCDAQQGYYLSSGAYDVVVSWREYICRSMKNNHEIVCFLPQEGSLLVIDNIVVNAVTKKDDLIYKFLNFLYSYEVLKSNTKNSYFLPAHREVFEELGESNIGLEGLHPNILESQNITVFKSPLHLNKASEFWVSVKSS